MRPRLSFFCVPKPFIGLDAVIQRNAINSWLRLEPKPEIIIMGNEVGVEELSKDIGAKHIPEIAVNKFGTPLIDDIFKKAWKYAENPILTYINSDIILMPEFTDAIIKICSKFYRFLMIGQRWDLMVLREIDFKNPLWVQELKEEVNCKGFLHGETGIDYFVHPKNLWSNIPPFAIGRTAWDNWLVQKAFNTNVQIIDATKYVMAIHQEHGFSHCGGRENAWNGIEALVNRLMAGNLNWNANVSCAKWELSESGDIVIRCEVKEPKCYSRFFKINRLSWLVEQYRRARQEGYDELAEAYIHAIGNINL